MMCEHELRGEEAWAFLVNSLAAANARVAELENQKPSYKKEFDCVYEKLKAEESLSKHYNQRAEAAEAQCAYWENKYKELTNGQ